MKVLWLVSMDDFLLGEGERETLWFTLTILCSMLPGPKRKQETQYGAQ